MSIDTTNFISFYPLKIYYIIDMCNTHTVTRPRVQYQLYNLYKYIILYIICYNIVI